MTEQNGVVCIIPARSGSKGIPSKNIKDFNGHPLLAWSIAAAKLTSCINRIIVSTDDEEYANLAKKYGAEAPFLRPKILSMDSSLDIDYLRHVALWLDANEDTVPRTFVILRPTSPLRDPSVLETAINLFQKEKKITSLRSMQASPVIPEKCYRLSPDNKIKTILSRNYMGIPRQKIEKAYIFNGYIDIVRLEIFMNSDMVFGEKIYPLITESTIDIDTALDWEYLEYVVKKSPSQLLNYLQYFN